MLDYAVFSLVHRAGRVKTMTAPDFQAAAALVKSKYPGASTIAIPAEELKGCNRTKLLWEWMSTVISAYFPRCCRTATYKGCRPYPGPAWCCWPSSRQPLECRSGTTSSSALRQRQTKNQNGQSNGRCEWAFHDWYAGSLVIAGLSAFGTCCVPFCTQPAVND